MLTLTPIVCVASAMAISTVLETYLYDATEPVESIEEETKPSSKSSSSTTEERVKTNKFGINPSSSLRFPLLICIGVVLVIFAFHCSYVTSTAYSSPSVVLESRNRDGSQHIIDDFREAYYWLRQNVIFLIVLLIIF